MNYVVHSRYFFVTNGARYPVRIVARRLKTSFFIRQTDSWFERRE